MKNEVKTASYNLGLNSISVNQSVNTLEESTAATDSGPRTVGDPNSDSRFAICKREVPGALGWSSDGLRYYRCNDLSGFVCFNIPSLIFNF